MRTMIRQGTRHGETRSFGEPEDCARNAMDKLPAHLYAFCTCYFLGGCSVADTCKILDRDETTFYRYKREVKKMLG